ncbi:Nucleolar protein 12 [Actinomortierella ambigua]|nr:Nucleolar protein 12 [Actinomortierella ambigua]
MSLTASLLKGAKVDSSLDSLFKNSAGPAMAIKTQEPVQPRKPKVTDIDEPKIKQKNPKPKKQQPKKKADSDEDQDNSEEEEEEEEEEEAGNKNKKKAAKKSVEEKYEAKKATEAKKKQAKSAAPKETRELLKKQTKYDYGEEEDDFKPEDLVHESLRNKRKASEDGDDQEEDSPTKKSKQDDAEDSDSGDDEEEVKVDKVKNKKAFDEERRTRTLFVGNLSVSAISKGDFKKLKQKFSEYGKIDSIRFRSVAFSELLPRKIAFITGKLHPERDVVNAYIVYKEKESIAKAVAAMNGQLFLNKHVRVDTADGEKNYNPKKSVFVGNLAFDAQEEDLWNFFKDSGDIENVRIIRDRKTNLGKGFAYVQFQDRASVDLALRLHDTKIGSRKLRVIRCKRIEDVANKTNGMQQRQSQDGKKTKGGKHSPITSSGGGKPEMTGAAKRLALKAAKAKGRHTLKKGGDVIVEGERATKGAKIDLGIKKGKAKVKANVPKKKKVKPAKK